MKRIILTIICLIVCLTSVASYETGAQAADLNGIRYYNHLEGEELIQSVHQGYLHFRFEGRIYCCFMGECSTEQIVEWIGDVLPEGYSFRYEDYTFVPSFPNMEQRSGEMIWFGPVGADTVQFTYVYIAVPEETIEETVLAIARKKPDRLYFVNFDLLDGASQYRGDLDWNGNVDAKDYFALKRIILAGANASVPLSYACDVDSNGEIDAMDYFQLKRIVLNGASK